jgi:hypothetical protein
MSSPRYVVQHSKRFNEGSIGVSKGALRHFRSHPCRVFSESYGSEAPFTAVTRVQIPSGTPSLFSNLRFHFLLNIGTKKAQFSASTQKHFAEAPVFSYRSRHFEQAQIRNTPSRPVSTRSRFGRLEKTNDAALRSPFLNCDGLGICIQRHAAGGVAKEFLGHLDICSVCSEQ